MQGPLLQTTVRAGKALGAGAGTNTKREGWNAGDESHHMKAEESADYGHLRAYVREGVEFQQRRAEVAEGNVGPRKP